MAEYDLNDLQSDAGHLSHLMETIYNVLAEDCQFVVPDGFNPGDRLPSMDRLSSLLWIGRDLADSIDKHIDDTFRIIGSTCAPRANAAFIDLYSEWKLVRHAVFPTDEQSQANHKVYKALQQKITSMVPKTAQDIAIQIVVETDDGESDYREMFFERLRALANAPCKTITGSQKAGA